jgi:hypothetical protein
MLLSKLNLAKVAVAQGQSPAAVSALRQIAQQADSMSLKYLSVESSVYMAQAMMNSKNYSASLHELEQQLGKSEKLGLEMETAKIQYLMGTSLRLSGDETAAALHYREALQLLDEMKKEPGADHLLDRSDLHAIYEEASRWAQKASA